jgi:hypothetical protein
MRIDIQLTPEQISDVVSIELMRLYEDMAEDSSLLMEGELENEAALMYLKHIIEYYTPPSKFDEWLQNES